MDAVHKNSIEQNCVKRVTKWYVFGGEFANGFEGGGFVKWVGK